MEPYKSKKWRERDAKREARMRATLLPKLAADRRALHRLIAVVASFFKKA